MPLQPLQFRPGVNKEITTLAGKGGWFDCDKIRFRAGYPEKIGGWAALSYSTFLGVARSLWNWVTLKNFNLLGIGTNLKFYVEDGGAFYDITPIRSTTTAGAVTFSAITVAPFSATVTITNTGHGCITGDFVTFSDVDASGLGGNITQAVLQQEYQVTVLTANTYTIQARVVSPIGSPGIAVLSNASDSGNGGAVVIGTYQINTGSATFTVGTGWGTGLWSRGTWGSGFTLGVGQQLRLWSQSNYGEDLLFSPRGGAIFLWQPGAGTAPAYATRGVLVSGADVPSRVNKLLVSDATRITICFGASDFGAYGAAPFDPMLIRWSAQEDYNDWTPSATNQAGSYRLSTGSEIITALQTRQEILVWTNSSLYSMQYLGPPFVFGFNLLVDNLSIIGPNAVVTAAGITFWMGVDKFYVYSGRVETLKCSVWKYVFDDINIEQAYQVFAGINERFNEIWWFYCSSGSTSIDKYVIYNYVENAWYYGNLARTAWLDSALRDFPQAATENNLIVLHEAAVDDGSVNPPIPISSYIQSADFDIASGDKYGFVWRMVPDITFNGSSTLSVTDPKVRFKMKPRKNPGSAYRASNSPEVVSSQNYSSEKSYEVQEFTQLIFTRVRGRQMAFRIESDTLGTQWQLGIPKIDIRSDGSR
jgi:hypothetical protein